jgi:hypothetical protein
MAWGSVAEIDERAQRLIDERAQRLAARARRLESRDQVHEAKAVRDAIYALFVTERCLATKSDFIPVDAYGDCLFLALFLCWQRLRSR